MKTFFKISYIFWIALCIGFFFYHSAWRAGVHLTRVALPSFESLPPTASVIEIILFHIPINLIKITIFAISAIGIGSLFYKRHRNNALISFLIGESFFSISFVLLFLTEIFNSITVSAICFTGLLLFLRNFPKNLTWSNLIFYFPGILGWINRFAVGILGISTFLAFSRLSYDAATQYFVQSKFLAITNQGDLLSLKDNMAISALFMNGLHAAIIQIFGDSAARMYTWLNGIISLAITWKIGQRNGVTNRTLPIFLTMSVTTTAFTDLLGDGKIDLLTLPFLLGAIYLLVVGIQEKEIKSFQIAGLFSGIAIVSRPHNALLLLIFAFFYLALQQKLKNAKFTLSQLGNFAFPIIFISGFYLFANALILQNPLAPILTPTQESTAWPFYPSQTLQILLTMMYPIVITYMGYFDTLGNMTPLVLSFLPLAISAFRNDRNSQTANTNRSQTEQTLSTLAVPALITIYSWLILFGFLLFEIRHILFLWLIMILFIAAQIQKYLDVPLLSETIKISCLGLLVFMLFRTMLIFLITYTPYHQEPLQNFECKDLAPCQIVTKLNNIAKPAERILVLGGYRYYLRPDLLAETSTRKDYIRLENAAKISENAFWKEVICQNYRFIIYDSFYTQYILRFTELPSFTTLPDWIEASRLHDVTYSDYNNRSIHELILQIEPDEKTQATICQQREYTHER